MSKVVLDVSMSLDGFIAGPNGREAEPRRVPPRKSGPPRRSRGTPIRIQRRAENTGQNCWLGVRDGIRNWLLTAA